MPLLMCPNCQVEMKEIERGGVRVDICAQCRGVWLDRGELERLLEPIRQAERDYARDFGDRDRFEERSGARYDPRYDNRHKRRKSPWKSILDVFD